MGKPFLGASKHLCEWVCPPSIRPLRLFIFGDIDVLISTAWPVLAPVVYEMNASISYIYNPLCASATEAYGGAVYSSNEYIYLIEAFLTPNH